jgi:opacity protein-like surface antigen
VRWLVGAAGVIAISVAAVAAAWAEDSDELRGYLQLKFRGTNGTGVHDSYGFGLGVNLNRYVGVELSGDHFEIFPKVSGFGTIGEYGVFAVMPQIRLRYPFLGDKLVPYIVGGGGIAFTDFNDRKAPVFGVSVKDESTTPVGALGAGIEYFLADNIAFGVEFKYLFAGDQTLQVGGSSHRINASTPLTTFSLRMFYPELRPTTFPADAPTPPPARLYVGFRAGVAVPTDTEIAPGIEARPLPYAIGGALNEYFGVAVGLDIRRYLGVDLAVEGYETVMAVHGVGSVGEYAFYSVMPQLRLRYPLAGDRLVPYAIGGVGVGHAEFNDRKPRGAGLSISAVSNSVATTAGAGIEYFITGKIAAGVETKYSYSPGHTIKVNGHSEEGILQALLVSVGLRVYLTDFGR